MASEGGDNIRVCVRVRPLNEKETANAESLCLFVKDNTIILDSKPTAKTFTFDFVADSNYSQDALFDQVALPILKSCFDGYNGTIFAYGQTGSGKTYTIQGGLTENGEEIVEKRGLIPRTLQYVFSHIKKTSKPGVLEYLCKCSYFEIYQETITDLFNPSAQRLQVREDIKKGVYVENLTEYEVTNAEDAYALLRQGSRHRHVGATAKNKQSSRSHSIYTLYIESKETKPDGALVVKYSRLHLVDLAGSERQKSTEATGLRLKEAAQINKSLLTLGNVIRSLEDIGNGRERHIHYRDSKLTFILKDSLGGNSKTTIVATVSPAAADFGETLSTLKFAQRAKRIKNNAVVNEDTSGSILQLQMEIMRLRKELQLKEANNRPPDGFSGIQMHGVSTSPLVISSADQVANDTRVKELETLLSEAMDHNQQLMRDNQALAEEIERFKQINMKKEYFVQITKMLVMLRDSTIARLKACINGQPLDSSVETDELRKEVHLLKLQLQNDPRLVEKEIENLQLCELLERYEQLYAGEESEYIKLRQFVSDLSQQIKKIIAEKHALLDKLNSASNADVGGSPSKPQNAVRVYKYEQQLEALRAELDDMKLQAMAANRKFQQREIELESELQATQQSLEELQQQMSLMEANHRQEKEAMRQEQMQMIESLKASYEQKMLDASQADSATVLSVLALEKQVSQLVAERDKLLDDLKERDATIRLMRRELTQKQMENRRMSVCLSMHDRELREKSRASGGPSTSGRPSMGFGQHHLLAMLEATADDNSLSTDTTRQSMIIEAEVEKRVAVAVREHEQALAQLNQQHEATVNELKEKILNLESELDSLRQIHSEVLELNETQQDELEFTRQRLSEAEAKWRSCEAKIEQLNKQIQTLQEEKQTIQETLEESQRTLRQANHEKVNTLMEQQQQLRNEITRLKEDLDQRNVTIEEQRVALEEAKQQIATLETSLSASRQEHAIATQLLENAKLASKAKDEKIADLTASLEDISSQLREKEEELASINKLHQTLEEVENERDDYKEQLEEMLKEAKEKQEQIRELLAAQREAESKHEAERIHLENEIESLKAEISDLHDIAERDAKSYAVREASLRSEIANLREQLEQRDAKIVDQEATIRQMKQENESLRTSLETAHEELNKSAAKSSEGASHLKALTERLELKEKQLSQLQSSLSALKNEATQHLMKVKALEAQNALYKTQEAKWLESSRNSDAIRTRQAQKIKELMEEKRGLLEKISDLDSALEQSLKKQEELLAQQRKYNQMVEAMTTEHSTMLERIKRLEAQNILLAKERDSERAAREKLDSQVTKLIDHQNHAQKIHYHVKVKEENDHLKEQVKALRRKNAENDTLIQRLTIEIKRLNSQLSGSDSLPFDLTEEAKLKQQIEQQEREKLHLVQQNQSLKEQLEAIRRALQSDDSPQILTDEDAIKRIAQLRAQNRSYQFELEMKQKESELLRSKLHYQSKLASGGQDNKENSIPNTH